MAKIPASVDTKVISGLELYRKGKVRNTYRLPHHPELLLSVASDRISIFDFVLPIVVPFKGEVLTALNIFWRKNVLGDLVAHDLAAYGAGIDPYLSEYLRGNPELKKRALVIRMLDMLPVEVIVRGYLTGSGLTAYKKERMVCGHILPEGLDDGAELPYPIFTPTTKAEEGHDEHIDADSVCEKYGFPIERESLQLYELARKFARDRGIVLADTKFEVGREKHGELVLCDEVFTPDSSRFWDLKAWQESRTKRSSPPSLDKQYVRNEGKRLGLDDKKRNPLVARDVEWVHMLEFPLEVVEMTTRIYRYIFWRLTGIKLEAFQRTQMDIGVALPPVHVHVVLGSESDRYQAQKGLNWLVIDTPPEITTKLDIISCHRNSEELRQFAKTVREDSVIIAGAGKAAALPGVLQAWLKYFGKGHIPVLGVAFDGGTDSANAAARLSIEELPGNPVILTPEGTAYFGSEGFFNACVAAVKDEFFVVPAPTKEAKHNVPLV